MYHNSAMIMTLNTLTSTHPGSGTELSFVDLPIQREGHTGYPKIEASTLKGCIRSSVSQSHRQQTDQINSIFGLPDQGEFASAVSMTDARLLFFPVRSVKGVFGWITCPMVLARFFQDYQMAKGRSFMECPPEGERLVPKACGLVQTINQKPCLMLEEYTYQVKPDQRFELFLEEVRKKLLDDSLTKARLGQYAVLVGDDDFASFVKHSTEVGTRIKMNPETGTAADGALFSEEFLPPECVFYSLIFFTQSHLPQQDSSGMSPMNPNQVRSDFLKLCSEKIIQIGADATLGKGLVQVKFV